MKTLHQLRPKESVNGYHVSSRRKGFTLIELLVVIAIISLLVSILLPSLQKARSLTKRVVCATTQRQVATACLFYADDNAEYLPRPVNMNNAITWQRQIGPYFGDHTDWPDPSVSVSYEDIARAGLRCAAMDVEFPGVGISLFLPPLFGWGTMIYDHKEYWPSLTKISSPGNYPIHADAQDWHLGDPYEINMITGYYGGRKFDVVRHDNGCNAAFCDTHVDFKEAEQFIGSANPAVNEQAVFDFFLGQSP